MLESARQEGPAGHRAVRLRHDQRGVHPAEGGARTGPRRAARAELVGDEPFAVVLADDVIDAEVPCVRQLLDVHDFFCAPVLAVMEVPPEKISAYGAIDAEPVSHNGSHDRVFRIRDLVEKPKQSEAPSNLAIIGRYVLTPEIFDSINCGRAGHRRRNPVDRRPQAPLAHASDLRLPLRRHALRRRRQAGLSEGDGRVRPAPARFGRTVPRVSEDSRFIGLPAIIVPLCTPWKGNPACQPAFQPALRTLPALAEGQIGEKAGLPGEAATRVPAGCLKDGCSQD